VARFCDLGRTGKLLRKLVVISLEGLMMKRVGKLPTTSIARSRRPRSGSQPGHDNRNGMRFGQWITSPNKEVPAF
jgi:hypothetical protein